MLIPNPKSDESVILVDHVRVYSVLSNFAEKAAPLLVRLRGLQEAIELRKTVINAAFLRFEPPKEYVRERWQDVRIHPDVETDYCILYQHDAAPDVCLRYDSFADAYANIYTELSPYKLEYRHQVPCFPKALAIVVDGLHSDLDIARMAVGPYVMAKASAKEISSMEDGSSLALLHAYEKQAEEWLARADAFDEEAQYQMLAADLQQWQADKLRAKAEKPVPVSVLPKPLDSKIPTWFIPLVVVVGIILIFWAKSTFPK